LVDEVHLLEQTLVLLVLPEVVARVVDLLARAAVAPVVRGAVLPLARDHLLLGGLGAVERLVAGLARGLRERRDVLGVRVDPRAGLVGHATQRLGGLAALVEALGRDAVP